MPVHSLGFLGCGTMGEALIRGATKVIPKISVGVLEKNSERATYLHSTYPEITILSTPSDLEKYDALLIAVKPQQFEEATSSLKKYIRPKQLIISIVAGIPLATLEIVFSDCSCVRAMPNTPALIGHGMTGISFAGGANGMAPNQEKFVTDLFSSVGLIHIVPDDLMNAVTALSGSGPAYFYHVLDVMATQAVSLGLTYDVALTLLAQTMAGAAKMIQQSKTPPATLITHVSSPGGTTEAAMKTLLASDLSLIWHNTFQSAVNRAEELSRP